VSRLLRFNEVDTRISNAKRDGICATVIDGNIQKPTQSIVTRRHHHSPQRAKDDDDAASASLPLANGRSAAHRLPLLRQAKGRKTFVLRLSRAPGVSAGKASPHQLSDHLADPVAMLRLRAPLHLHSPNRARAWLVSRKPVKHDIPCASPNALRPPARRAVACPLLMEEQR
jgi:hypothetical protein